MSTTRLLLLLLLLLPASSYRKNLLTARAHALVQLPCTTIKYRARGGTQPSRLDDRFVSLLSNDSRERVEHAAEKEKGEKEEEEGGKERERETMARPDFLRTTFIAGGVSYY